MLLDNDFYILVKRHLIPHPILKYEKSFPHFCRYFYYRYRSITLYHDAPMDTRRRRSASEFSTERAKSKAISKQPHYVGSQNHDQVASYLQKNQKLAANFHTRRLYFKPKFSQVTEYFARIEDI
jgi:hypothetical protein